MHERVCACTKASMREVCARACARGYVREIVRVWMRWHGAMRR